MPRYPSAHRLDLVEDVHGHQIADPYRWLEDALSPATREWTQAQAVLARSALDALPGRERLHARLSALAGSGSTSAPVWRAGRAFWTCRAPGEEHPVLWWRDAEGVGHRLVDPIVVDPSGLTTLDDWWPSNEGDRVAYQLSVGGSEESELRTIEVDTGQLIDGPITRTRYSSVAWVPGGSAFYYVRRLPPAAVPLGEEEFHRRVWRHQVGESTGQDELVWGEGLAATNYYSCSLSEEGRWLVVSASAGTAPRDDVWLFDLVAGGAPAPVQVGVDARCQASVRQGRLWLLTDRAAPRGRLCVADPSEPQTWTVVLPEDPEAVLTDVAHVDTGFVALRVRHALAELSHHAPSGHLVSAIALPGPGTVLGVTSEPEGGSNVWFGWTDPATPARAHRWHATSGRVSVWQDAPGRPALGTAVSRQCSFTSAEGTTVRALVLSPTGEPDRPRPTVLYGYGGFGISLTPSWSSSALAWVEAGGVWVEANLRGGGEEGEDWHRAGMRDQKQNVFDDFSACADALVGQGWTTPAQLGIYGGSNGGLLVGAAMTQRPGAYAAVVCSAPLLDMVRYELFGLGRTWNDEYGTAAAPSELTWLVSYSPYHAVREACDYPAVLFTVFDGDTRVDVMHARKMCAALQSATTSEDPVLFRLEADVGHGARAVSRSLALQTDVLAFLAEHTGLVLP